MTERGSFITFTRLETGELGFRLGRIRGFIGVYDWKKRVFLSASILGAVKLPRRMSLREAVRWVNRSFQFLRKRFPDVEEFQR